MASSWRDTTKLVFYRFIIKFGSGFVTGLLIAAILSIQSIESFSGIAISAIFCVGYIASLYIYAAVLTKQTGKKYSIYAVFKLVLQEFAVLFILLIPFIMYFTMYHKNDIH
ncbi:hypothetical protein [Photobacterium leiognathi]|uniref:hypothetical protein n=1 Tax=Photobacterium leiognathi TaxID=553611 RepID=UPI002980B25C|nr:hypothetical protein [Photobacterium leiognathi]